MRTLSAAAVAVMLFALPGCTESEEWPGRELEDADPPWRDTDLAPGFGLEMDFPLRKDQQLQYDWFVMERTALPFEIHYHRQDGADETVFQNTLVEHQGPFTAPESAMYSLLWKNTGDRPVELWIQVEGEQCYAHGCGTVVEL